MINRFGEVLRETKCRVGDEVRENFWIERRVRQGCSLSPFLFNLLIANLEKKLRKGVGVE